MMASAVSKSPAVRARLLALQRELGKNGGVQMDGRDIGTVVFPDAELKFFLEASAEERGKRRYLELKGKGMDVDLARITREIKDRDHQDSERLLRRSERPTDVAPDAFESSEHCWVVRSVQLTQGQGYNFTLSFLPCSDTFGKIYHFLG